MFTLCSWYDTLLLYMDDTERSSRYSGECVLHFGAILLLVGYDLDKRNAENFGEHKSTHFRNIEKKSVLK